MMARTKLQKEAGQSGDPDALRHVIAVQLEAVMGDSQKSRDVVLVGDYERDRAACEAAIERALAELNEAGDNVDPKSNEFDLAWAWWKLNEAYLRLAHLTSRTHLARRRAELEAERAEKARKAAEHA
jgi:hypothetical protein